jgi:putative transposase
MRLPRPQIEDCCVHVTHRCQERRFLLRFGVDRRRYRARLLEASRRFRRVRFLDYVITSNHVHLLLWVPRMADLSAMMHWLQGTAARDCNRRKGREGSVWRGRFHPTLVQTGSHLSRCLFYLDMNMVRAGVVTHPFQWRFGGAAELGCERQRNRIVDQARLLECLEMAGQPEQFRAWYRATLAELCGRPVAPRERFWSSAFAVGDRGWLAGLTGDGTRVSEYIRPVASGGGEADTVYALEAPASVLSRLWRRLRDA